MATEERVMRLSEAMTQLERQHAERQVLWVQTKFISDAVSAVDKTFSAAKDGHMTQICPLSDEERGWYMQMQEAMHNIARVAHERHNALGRVMDANIVAGLRMLSEMTTTATATETDLSAGVDISKEDGDE